MKKLIISTVVALSVLSTTAAFAGPPARQASGAPCNRPDCPMVGKVANVALPRAGQYGLGALPCRHGAVATNVRWGNAQKSCPHCNHSG